MYVMVKTECPYIITQNQILKGYLTNKEDHNSYHWGVILEFRNKISKSQLLIKNQLLLLEFKEYYKLLYMCTYDCNHH